MADQRLLLLYTDNKKKEKQIVQMCRESGIRIRRLKALDVNRPVAALIGLGGKSIISSGEDRAPAEFVMPEVCIFCGFEDASLDTFLVTYKERQIEPIKYKAVVTPYNVHWSVYRLLQALIEERKHLTGI